MVKYLIFGNGFLGNRFANYLGDDVVLIKSKIETIEDIEACILEFEPEIVINAIGRTGRPNIDWCESNKERTFESNVTIPTYLAECCENNGVRLVHLGSGCIYESNRCSNIGFSENDSPNFKGSWYSKTKIFAEDILNEYKNVLQLRIRMPIDSVPSPRNLIDKLVGYKQVINAPNSVTVIPDLLAVAKILMDNNEKGIFNVVNKGTIKHEQILTMYKNIVDPNFTMPEFISPEKLNTIAGRSNCILYPTRLEGMCINMPYVLESVENCLHEYRKNLKGE